jgi:hypothetical protein
MLSSIKDLVECRIQALGGEAGRVRDVYIDDRLWAVVYLVVDTCKWLSDRSVLILPSAVTSIDWHRRTIALSLSRMQVDLSPDVTAHEPVSRQKEAQYGPYAALWTWGTMPVILETTTASRDDAPGRPAEDSADAHLRSSRVVQGYHIRASDDSVGHAADFLFDEETWAIRYLIADTRNWPPGKHVLISPQRIREVDWLDREFRVNLTRRQIERSPEYAAGEFQA